MFEILAPMMFPDKISDASFLTAMIPDISSGSEVPIPTINTPITKVGKPKYFPIVSAAIVKYFAASKSPESAAIK